MTYYIEIATTNKAKQDIDAICREEGYCNLTRYNFGEGGIGRFMTKLVSVLRILTMVKRGDTLVLQYPMKKFYKMACRLAKWKGANVVTIIHDLGAFRRKKLTPEGENRRLSLTDFLIVHNATMRDYLLEHGFKGGIHCLEIFDYLSEKSPAAYKTPHEPQRVVYAGNLGRWRNEFLYKLEACITNWEFDLYGNGFDAEASACPRVRYHGFMPSDDFISKVEADFGLVWDGDSVDECTGAWGEYLKINNPHKTSFYLRAGVPVIVWSRSAMAPFITQMNVGIAIDSIRDIEARLAALSTEQYAAMKEAAQKMQQRLAAGYYFKEGVAKGAEYLSNQPAKKG